MRYSTPLSYNSIDVARLTEVLNRYTGVHHNQLITDFESALSQATGSPFVVALNSGTASIHLALKVLGVNSGDYVIVPTFTYVATINPILYLGAIPVLIDSEAETWNMDPELLEKAIRDLKSSGKVPKAIIVVHTYGMPAKMNQILSLAEEHGIPVLEDAAESLGSTYHQQMTGTLASIGILSFNTNKLVTTFGGGAVLTKNAMWAERIRFLATQSRENQPYYEHKETGYNYRMSVLNAAYGLLHLEDLDEEIKFRRGIYESYQSNLQSHIFFLPEPAGIYSNRWLSVGLFKSKSIRDRVFNELQASGIESRLCWKPMHDQPLARTYKAYLKGYSNRLFEVGLCLPSGSLPSDSYKMVRNAIIKALNN